MKSRAALLHQAADLAAEFLETLPDRDVRSAATRADLIASMGGPLPERGALAEDVVADLARSADPGIVASAGPRYFGFVIGGGLPAALAADWLTSTWDQNGFSFVMSPAASVAEEIAADWILELLGLPSDASVGFTTGVTMASFTGLAAGRHRLLQRVGWDVEDDGLARAPEIAVVIGAEAHATVFASLQMLGLGRKRVIKLRPGCERRAGRRQLGRRIIAPGSRDPDLCGRPGAGSRRSGGPRGTVLRAGRTDGGPPSRSRGRGDSQRCRA